MSELGERRWAVISEHGCESSGLTYTEAHALMLRLANEKVHGLSVVTDEAARHFLRAGSAAPLSRETADRRGQS
jgi:DNA-directed RNA polymerase subunit F